MTHADEPLDDWRQERDEIREGALLAKDGKQRVRFWRRADGQIQFEDQKLEDREEEGGCYSVWLSQYPSSGLYPDLAAAQNDAKRLFPWLRTTELD